MTIHEDDPDTTPENTAPPSKVVRIVGTAAACVTVFVLSLGAADLLSQKAISRAVGISDADASAPFSDWLPQNVVTDEDIDIVLATRVEPELNFALPPVAAVTLAVASVQPEPPALLRPLASGSQRKTTPLPLKRPGVMTLASVDPARDVSIDDDVRSNDVEAMADDAEPTAAIPLPVPAPERPPLPPTPAERLKLTDQQRAKAEKCLAQAVYFEARGERLRGQIAVAQVVMNRVFSPFYPNDVCGVVYQNAHRHLSCQFTFVCDGRPERVTEWGAWRRAKMIAKRTLEGKIWVAEVAKSTHYHAACVQPRWVRGMKRMVRYGTHAFYRPRKWGDGSRETDWSNISRLAAEVVIVE